jgi:hypothetical protein
MVDIAEEIATGKITTAQAKQEAGPPPKPNTQAPKTVSVGPDGKAVDPRDLEANGSWSASAPMPDGPDGQPIQRPATPLSATSAANNPLAGTSAAAKQGANSAPSEAPIPYEDRLDAYLLGRALRDWSSEEYLDELGIDRVQCDAYALALGFEERIQAIRRLSSVLMDSDPSYATAR